MARPFLLLSVVAVALVALACGFATPALVPTPKPTVPVFPPGAVVVDLEIKNFHHLDAEIAPGATVVWTNLDRGLHTIRHIAETGEERLWSSWPVGEGEQYHYTFDKPGVYRYICEIHPQMMQAAITVVESAGS